MNEEEKAEELIQKMFNLIPIKRGGLESFLSAKHCALLCVNEIIATCPQKENEIFAVSKGMKYWEKVRKNIDKAKF